MKNVLRPIVGNWAGGESFFDREDETAALIRLITRGTHVSVAAPRRVGKTSLLREVARQLDTTHTCVFVDLEGCLSPEDAIAEIAEKAGRHAALGDRVKAWCGWLLAGTEIDLQVVRTTIRDSVAIDWQTRGNRLIGELCQTDRPVVLFLDEIPVLIAGLLQTGAGRTQADLFLSWLRRLLQEHPTNLRVVLTGSIGLAPLVARAGLSATLNMFHTVRLEPWSRDVTIAAFRALAAWDELALALDVPGAAFDRLGIGVPFHVQLLHQAMAEDAVRRKSETVGVQDVERAWLTVVGNPSSDLPHWEQRLRKALPTEQYRLAIDVLTAAAAAEPLTAAAAFALAQQRAPSADEARDLLRAVLDTLEHDGYLGRQEGGWYYPNRLLRTWWASQYASVFGEGR